MNWITNRRPEVEDGDKCLIWSINEGPVVVSRELVQNAPWCAIPAPYVETKPERLERWIAVSPIHIGSYISLHEAEKQLERYGGTLHHLVERLPTDIDQDVVAKVLKSMLTWRDDSSSFCTLSDGSKSALLIYGYFMEWIDMLTPKGEKS